jgi:hypothetical protein
MKIFQKDLSDDDQFLNQLEHFMYGYNYQVTFGFLLLEKVSSIETAKVEIKKKFTGANTDSIHVSNFHDFWEEVNSALDYRGDETAGLILNKEKEKTLQELQGRYKEFLSKYINDNSSIYHLNSSEGIPGYSVYWDFRFIIINDNGIGIFVYGSSSD